MFDVLSSLQPCQQGEAGQQVRAPRGRHWGTKKPDRRIGLGKLRVDFERNFEVAAQRQPKPSPRVGQEGPLPGGLSLARRGRPRPPTATAREFASSLADRPQWHGPVADLTALYERVRFGGQPLTSAETRRVARLLNDLARAPR